MVQHQNSRGPSSVTKTQINHYASDLNRQPLWKLKMEKSIPHCLPTKVQQVVFTGLHNLKGHNWSPVSLQGWVKITQIFMQPLFFQPCCVYFYVCSFISQNAFCHLKNHHHRLVAVKSVKVFPTEKKSNHCDNQVSVKGRTNTTNYSL